MAVKGFWGSYPGLVMLYGSFLVHYALGCRALWVRRTLRVRPAELAQIVLGFSLPVLLCEAAFAMPGTVIGVSFLGTAQHSTMPSSCGTILSAPRSTASARW